VITRRAADTQGGLATAGVGNTESATSLRRGGKVGSDGHFRVYGLGLARDDTKLANSSSPVDGPLTGPSRTPADWGTPRSGFTLQGDAYRSDIDQAAGGSRDLAGGNVLARWTRALRGDSSLRVQFYYDRVERHQPGSIRERLDTWDVEAQHGLA